MLNNILKVIKYIKVNGFIGFSTAVYKRLFPKRLECYKQYLSLFENKVGLEIGGPSIVFNQNGMFPVYAVADRVDNCNFSHQTVWEGDIKSGATFQYNKHKSPGIQHVCEASNLNLIPSSSYDFVLSSHAIEHVANPLLALSEWIRVVKVGGLLMLVVPHKEGTFDHKREVTPLVHLVADYKEKVTEADLTHLEEILAQHDLSMDPEAGSLEEFKLRSEKNFENRCLHHHVFNTASVVEMINHMNLQILSVEAFRPYHIVVLTRKTEINQSVDNENFRGIYSAPNWTSPFKSDLKG